MDLKASNCFLNRCQI